VLLKIDGKQYILALTNYLQNQSWELVKSRNEMIKNEKRKVCQGFFVMESCHFNFDGKHHGAIIMQKNNKKNREDKKMLVQCTIMSQPTCSNALVFKSNYNL